MVKMIDVLYSLPIPSLVLLYEMEEQLVVVMKMHEHTFHLVFCFDSEGKIRLRSRLTVLGIQILSNHE